MTSEHRVSWKDRGKRSNLTLRERAAFELNTQSSDLSPSENEYGDIAHWGTQCPGKTNDSPVDLSMAAQAGRQDWKCQRSIDTGGEAEILSEPEPSAAGDSSHDPELRDNNTADGAGAPSDDESETSGTDCSDTDGPSLQEEIVEEARERYIRQHLRFSALMGKFPS